MIKNEQQKIIDGFVEAVGGLGASLGISKMVAKIYALLYLNEKPLSLDDIAEALKVSKGNVSLNIRYLESWQAVRRIWIKGERKDYYQADPDIKKIVYWRIREGLQRRISKFSQQLSEVEQGLKRSGDNGYRRKIEEIKKLLKLVERLEFIGKTFFGKE